MISFGAVGFGCGVGSAIVADAVEFDTVVAVIGALLSEDPAVVCSVRVRAIGGVARVECAVARQIARSVRATFTIHAAPVVRVMCVGRCVAVVEHLFAVCAVVGALPSECPAPEIAVGTIGVVAAIRDRAAHVGPRAVVWTAVTIGTAVAIGGMRCAKDLIAVVMSVAVGVRAIRRKSEVRLRLGAQAVGVLIDGRCGRGAHFVG